jgi:hypothetical protein
MKRLILFLGVVGVLVVSGCEDYQMAEKSKEVVISKEEYEQLKASAALAKQVGRYQIHKEGPRTWRLDTATGKSCLMLTTEADWKGDASTQSSCAGEDFREAQERHRLYPNLYDTSRNPLPTKQ